MCTGLPPTIAFASLYAEGCEAALISQSMHFHLSPAAIHSVLCEIRQGFVLADQLFDQEGLSAVRDTLVDEWRALPCRWSRIFSAKTCLSCLSRRPPILLRCGHRCCHDCVRFFASPVDQEHQRFHLNACMLCGEQTEMGVITLRRRFRRILQIDGGGVGGIIPLQFLSELESFIEVPGLLHHFFDYAIGTSSGMWPTLIGNACDP